MRMLILKKQGCGAQMEWCSRINGHLRPFSTQVQKPLKHTTTVTNRFSFAAMQVHQFFNATIKIHLNHLKSRERVNAGTTIEMGNWAIILYFQVSFS